MDSYTSLKKQLASLPKGYISKKVINGKERFYLQYREENQIKSTYIKSKDLSLIQKQIEERKQIEIKLKDILDRQRPLNDLSSSSLCLTGSVMEEDDVVASFQNNNLIYLDKKRAPSIFLTTPYLSPWLERRSIDNHRTNSRLLRKVLRLKDNNEILNVLHVNAVTITDNFWFKPQFSKLKYKDVVYTNDIYSDLALHGILEGYPSTSYSTPELSNTGSYEKCWKLIDNEWYMIKRGNKKEIFSELFCSKLAVCLGIPSANYELYEDNVITKNFANYYNLEPIRVFAGDDDSYENVYHAIENINSDFLDSYLLLMWFDALVDNVDRHNENLGVLRERKTGKIISLSPNYDNNMALYSLKENSSSSSFGLIKQFEKFITSNNAIKTRFLSLSLPTLTQETLFSILEEIRDHYRFDNVVDFILKRYEMLRDFKDSISH